jgi:hypothetical protein
MKTALYLDDIRTPIETPEGYEWVIVRSYDEFVNYLTEFYRSKRKLPEMIFFDHDLSEEHMNFYYNNPKFSLIRYEEFKEKTGLHCAKWLTLLCEKNKIDLRESKLYVHSHNPIGANNIQHWLNYYLKLQYGGEFSSCVIHKVKFKIDNTNDSKI